MYQGFTVVATEIREGRRIAIVRSNHNVDVLGLGRARAVIEVGNLASRRVIAHHRRLSDRVPSADQGFKWNGAGCYSHSCHAANFAQEGASAGILGIPWLISVGC